MSNIDKKLTGVEKLLNRILPTIYQNITDVKIDRNYNISDSHLYDDIPPYNLNIYTNLPNTLTKNDYWDNEVWETNENSYVLDYHYMNDVHVPELLEYFSIKDDEFDRNVKIYNIDNELILSTDY